MESPADTIIRYNILDYEVLYPIDCVLLSYDVHFPTGKFAIHSCVPLIHLF